MLYFDNIVLGEDKVWRFYWTATAATFYRLVLFGREAFRTTETSFAYDLPGWENYPPPLELVEENEKAFSEVNLPFLTVQWYKVNAANYYQFEELVDAEWTPRDIQEENPEVWVYTLLTPVLADEALHEYRVFCVDGINQQSDPRGYSVFTVTTPFLRDTTLSVTYDEGTTSIVVDEVV